MAHFRQGLVGDAAVVLKGAQEAAVHFVKHGGFLW
jgi:hypothetical protein